MAARRTGWLDCAAGFALGAFLAGAGSTPAAAEVSEDVRRDVTALVEDLALLVGLNFLEYDKQDIAESGTGLRVTLGGVRLLPDFEDHLAVDTLALVLELAEDGYRITGVELPSIIPLRSSDDQQDGEMRLGTLTFTGSWQRSISAFVETSLVLADATITSSVDSAQLALGAARLDDRLTPGNDGKWQDELSVDLTKLASVQDGTTDGFAGLQLHFLTEGIDLARHDQLQQLLAEVSEQAANGDPVDPALLASIRAMPDTAAASNFKVTVSDMQVDQGDGAPYVVPTTEFSVSAEGLDGARSRTILHLKFDGADLPVSAAVDPGLQDAVGPQSLDLNIAVDELPWPAMWGSLIDAGYAPSSDGGELPMLAMALQEAGTRLRLLPSVLSSDALNIMGSGEARADAAAALGMVAAFLIEIEGLSAAQSSAAAKPDGAGAADVLGQFYEMGQPATGADGKTVERYDIVLGADGMLTVNGVPMELFGPQ